jgi:hypothetical protein
MAGWTGRTFGLALGLALAAALAGQGTSLATASAKPPHRPNSKANPYTLHAFELPAGNGYTLGVFGVPAGRRSPAKVTVEAWNATTLTSYTASGRVSDRAMRASFGHFGAVDVRFRRSGVKRVGSRCGQGVEFFSAGTFEGSVSFVGEGGYTTALDDEVEVQPLYVSPWECAGSYSTRGAGRGVILQALSRYGETQIVQNDPDGRARFMASAGAHSDGVEIRRFAEVVGSPSSFNWEASLGSANASPPPPFSGSATYEDLGGRVTHWEGNLKVDFAGFPGYPLTPGPTYTAFDHGSCSPTLPAAEQGSGPPLGLCLVGWG